MTTLQEIENSLTGMMHGGSLNKVRNRYQLYERVVNTLLARLDPLETERDYALAQAVHDDLQNYPLPSDYKKTIDIYPQDDRQSRDRAARKYMETFAAGLSLRNKDIAIESNEGTKFIRINWKSTSSKTLHSMDSLTDDGDLATVGSASGLKINELYKLSGNASIELDLAVTGDGLSVLNKDTTVDLEDWDEMADFIVPVYFGDVTNFNSAVFLFGNDITTKYWTCPTETTQADGTAVKNGWNFFLFNWVGATETGTVDPATIDSFKLIFDIDGAISNVRIDNILVSLGRFFNLKYYSQYAFRTSAGVWISQPTTESDTCVLIGTALQIFLLECVVAMAQQIEGSDSVFDITWARTELEDLYRRYRAEHPSEAKKQIGNYTSLPRLKR